MSGSANTHARLSPSGSKRWMNCTASIGYIEANAHRIRGDGSSSYSDEGTEAHDWAEKYLKGTISWDDIPNDFKLPLGVYFNHCRGLIVDNPTAEVMIEYQAPLFYEPDPIEKERVVDKINVAGTDATLTFLKKYWERPTGTVDFALVSDDKVIIRDLKYGQGVAVDAEDNSQLAIYAMSIIRELEEEGLYVFAPDTIVDIGIVQPRYRGDEPVKTWVITLSELEIYCEDVERAVDDIHSGRGVFEPGEDTCRWCPAKGFCSARLDALAEPFDVESFDSLALLPDLTKDEKKLPVEERVLLQTPSSAHEYTDEELVLIHSKRKQITGMLDDIEEYLADRLAAGEKIPGVKMVLGREGNRAWNDEEAADKLIKQKLKLEERMDIKLKSPTQLEKILNLSEQSTRFQKLFNSFVSRSEGKPVMALESDKRPAIDVAVDLLPDIDEEGLD